MANILVNQFCRACEEFMQHSEISEKDIAELISLSIGGDMPDTLGQVNDRLNWLVSHEQMDSIFLVAGLVRHLDSIFEDISENYAKNLRKRRAFVAHMEGKGEPQEEIERLRRVFATPSLEEQRQARTMFDAWRQAMAPIIDSDNIDREQSRELRRSAEEMRDLEGQN